ncbi:thioredoxin family protein [Mucilaginibacter sp.]
MILKNKLLYRPLLLLAVTFMFCQSACSQTAKKTDNKNTKINFIENAWPEALKQAKAQHKYVFVDAYATWCGPCKMLKALTFTNNKAAEFYNSNFVNVALDMEKGMGPQLAAQWGMQAYPTLIIFDEDGNPVAGTVGFIGAKDLIKFGQAALNKKTL